MSKFCFVIVLLFCFSLGSYAQEGVSGIVYNIDLKGMDNTCYKKVKHIMQDSILEVPFFDDFAKSGYYPDPEKWMDNYAYINNTYPVNPPSIGVATLDAMDDKGELYTTYSLTSFVGDMLTSCPINLSYPSDANVVLSFFYQPEGIGDEPEIQDSLVLYFYAPQDSIWKRIWGIPGDTLQDFRLVSIPINDPAFLQSGFIFRFMNYVSFPKPQGEPEKLVNVDHWHIDYIYLDTARSVGNSSFNDVCITKPIKGILKTFSSIPSKHFPAAYNIEKASTLAMVYRNLNTSETKGVDRFMTIRNELFNYADNQGRLNINPGADTTVNFKIEEIPLIDNPPECALLKICAFVSPDSSVKREEHYKWNDTVRYNQELHNYYAYDDGSAENSYYASGNGINEDIHITFRYDIFQEDSLRAVDILFNPVKSNETDDLAFLIKVWTVEENIPGDTLYTDGFNERTIGTTGIFNRYILDRPVFIPKDFFIGIEQLEDKRYNIGLDRNNNRQGNIFYYLNNEWKKSTVAQGSLMMRPVMGNPLSTPVHLERVNELGISVYPNPADKYITLISHNINGTKDYTISIYHITGEMVYNATMHDAKVDVSRFDPGVYIMKITSGEGAFAIKKILISH